MTQATINSSQKISIVTGFRCLVQKEKFPVVVRRKLHLLDGGVERTRTLLQRRPDDLVAGKTVTQHFFVALNCHQPELDGFDYHYQGTVHFPLTRGVD